MHIEIKDNTEHTALDDLSSELWQNNGFFVATVGEKAKDYLSGRVFSLSELTCCAPVTFVNVVYFSDYKRWIADDEEAINRMEEDTRAIAKSCEKKQLYVLSEVEDLYTANQCCELANNVGDEGFSVLITHRKSETLEYFDKVRSAFKHIIYLPNNATYTTETLRWIICGFIKNGCIGVGYDDALYVLSNSEKSYCSRMHYKDGIDLMNSIEDYILQITDERGEEHKPQGYLLGFWAPCSSDLNEVDFVWEKVEKIASGDFAVTCLSNESETDNSWTISLLLSFSEKTAKK